MTSPANSYSTGLYQNPANIPLPTINTSADWTVTPDAPVTHAATYQTYFPYAGSAGTGTIIATRYYMSGTIGYTGTEGNTAAQVITGLKNAAAADGTSPTSTIYFEDSSNVRSLTRDGEWPATESQLTARGMSWAYQYNTPGATPLNSNNVFGTVCGNASLTLPNGSTYTPSSWADNLTSYGCDFANPGGQTLATAFIAAGASGTTGAVCEPYAIAHRFTNSSIYTFIADGCTLGEAFAKSVASPDIQMPLGDMLAQPFADVPKVAISTGPGSYGTAAGTISVGGSAALSVSSPDASAISTMELLIDGLVCSSSAAASGSDSFRLNTAGLSDGVHEARLVAINNAQAASEGYAAEQIVVDNHGRSISFNGGNLTLTASAAAIGLAAVAGDGTVAQVELTCLGRVVAQATGSPGALESQPHRAGPRRQRDRAGGRLRRRHASRGRGLCRARGVGPG